MAGRVCMLVSAAILVATAAQAQGRPDSRGMECGQIQSFIADRGAVVMTTGQHTYDRYVRDRWQCFSISEVAVRAFIASRDTAQCPVWRCEAIDPVERRGLFTN